MAIIEYLVGFVLIVVTTLVLYFKWTYGYWKRRNIPYIEPSIPMGNMENPLFMKKGFDAVLNEVFSEFRSQGKKYGGIFFLHKPTLLILDPELLKSILTKDFQHFRNHGNFIDEENDPLSGNLLNLEDEKWKNMRAKLSPTFSSGKMKIMFDAMLSCGDQLTEHISSLCSQRKPMDIKEVISCYGTDVIGTCAFGVECNSFKNPDAEFRKYGRKLTELNFASGVRIFVAFVIPELNKYLKLKIFPGDVSRFFTNAFKSIVDQRLSTNSKRNDFVQLLLELSGSHGGQSTTSLSMDEMLAQAFIFFLAGFETTSTNLSFCLYELALQPEIQQKVRDEVLEVLNRYDGQLTYDGTLEMKYMDQVIDESLRKYPSVPFLNRKCSKTYTIPGETIEIEEGTSLFISVRSLHMDEEYFPNPEKFDPERFSKENKAKIHPYTYLPFGDGPRVCIGRRFAIMQIKIGLSLILKKFKMLPHETTPKTITFSKKNIGSLVPDKDLLLNTEFYNA